MVKEDNIEEEYNIEVIDELTNKVVEKFSSIKEALNYADLLEDDGIACMVLVRTTDKEFSYGN